MQSRAIPLILKETLGYEVHSGYERVPEGVMNPAKVHHYEKIPFITEIVTLKKGDKIIDIIFTYRDCPIISVLNFHSSIVMNLFTGASIISIYPETTRQDISFKTKGFDTFTFDNSTQAEDAFQKYGRRGVTIVEANKCLDGSVRPHRCERDPVCPHTIRYIDDAFCCTWRIREEDPTLDKLTSTTWRQGGQPCFEGERGMDSLLIAGEGFVIQERDFDVYVTAYTR